MGPTQKVTPVLVHVVGAVFVLFWGVLFWRGLSLRV